VGEGFDDAAILACVTSANIACGGHAGDDRTIRATIRRARDHQVAVGAHPGFPDRTGFGRRVTTRDPVQIEDLVARQLEAFVAVARDENAAVTHVKPHGALYNAAATDLGLAEAITRAVRTAAPSAALVALAGSRLIEAARSAGLVVWAEGFVDRA